MLRRYINSKLMRKCTLIKDYALCLGNISKDFTIHDTKKTTELKGIIIIFSVNFNPIDINDILDIHKYLIKGAYYKMIFDAIKKMFTRLLTCTVR